MKYEERSKCKNAKEAMEIMERWVKEEHEEILSGQAQESTILEGRMMEFCDRWGIPFSEKEFYNMAKRVAFDAAVERGDLDGSENFEWWDPGEHDDTGSWSGWMSSLC